MTAPSATIKKVFLGCCDNASLIHDFDLGFRGLGYEVLSFVHQQASVQSSTVDYNLDKMAPRPTQQMTPAQQTDAHNKRQRALAAVWDRAIKECDLFVFVWDSFLPDFTDLAMLKQMGKKIVWWFVGNDCRWKTAHDGEVAPYGILPLAYGDEVTSRELTERLLRIRFVEAFADVILNTPQQAALMLRPYHDGLPFPLAMDRYPEHHSQRPQRDVPVVMHAPSNLKVKCTHEIVAALEHLRFNENINFEMRLMARMPHVEAVASYADSDVFVGQGRCLTLGKQDREVMALNRVLLGGVTPEAYPQKWPDDCPNVPFQTGQDLVDTLRTLLPDVARRREIAARGREWVSRYHDPVRVCARVLSALDGDIPPDFSPTYYRKSFEPENSDYLALHNRTLEVVKITDWYRKLVPSGTRAGLNF